MRTDSCAPTQPLSSEDEILHQAILGFLQLRGYVNDKHELTSWGSCYNKAVEALESAGTLVNIQTVESIFVAVEMLRLGVLGPNDWFPNHSGGPMRGSGTILIISSLALSAVTVY